MVLTNAFSLNMLAEFPVVINVREITLAEARIVAAGESMSAVGHTDTAAVFSAELGVGVACNRLTLSLTSGDTLLVGQYRGPRLPEGSTVLPEGATIQWLLVSIS